MAGVVSWLSGEFAVRGLEEAVQKYFEQRKKDAFEELTEALRNANVTLEEAIRENDTIAMLHRYDRAWREGAARTKLRLLAQLLAGEVGGGPEGADEFQRFADVVLALSRDEIIFLAALFKEETKAALENAGEGANKLAMERMHDQLVGEGKPYPHYDRFESVGFALSRTGLLVPRVLMSGGYHFDMTLELQRLVDLTRLERLAETLMREPQ